MGKPVIVSEAVPLKRIVEETGAGFSIDCSNSDSIADFIIKSQSFNWKLCSENALKFANEKYNWEIDKEILIKFVEKFL